MKMQSLIDFIKKIGLLVFVYGRPSSGKTSFAGTAPAPILFIHTGERGLKVLGPRDDIKVFDCPDSASAEVLFTKIGKSEEIAKHFKTIVVDSLHCLRELKIMEYAGDPDWNAVTHFVIKNIKALLPLLEKGINIILISHQSADDPGGQSLKKRYIPSMGERTSQAIVGRCDVVMYMNVEEVKEINPDTKKLGRTEQHVGYLAPCERYYSRVRVDHKTHKIPEKIVSPSFNDIQSIFETTTKGVK